MSASLSVRVAVSYCSMMPIAFNVVGSPPRGWEHGQHEHERQQPPHEPLLATRLLHASLNGWGSPGAWLVWACIAGSAGLASRGRSIVRPRRGHRRGVSGSAGSTSNRDIERTLDARHDWPLNRQRAWPERDTL